MGVWWQVLSSVKLLALGVGMLSVAGVLAWVGSSLAQGAALEREVELERAWREESDRQSRLSQEKVEAGRAAAERVLEEERRRFQVEKGRVTRQISMLAAAKVADEACGCTLDSPLPEWPE